MARKKRLNQIVAIERDVASRAYKDITKEYHLLQKPDLCEGFTKSYQPREEGGETFPPEAKLVQLGVEDSLKEMHARMSEPFDMRLTKDVGNRTAKADVVVDGVVLVKDAPVPTLLFLEKQLLDIGTVLGKLPVLDKAEAWKFDAARGYHVTEPALKTRTAKVQKGLVLYPHSDKHPAQTQLITEDVQVGLWSTVKHSAAVPEQRRKDLLARCEKLQKAVKDAREQANLEEVDELKMGDVIFDYLLKPPF